MQLAYLIFSLFVTSTLAFIWSTDYWPNTLTKVVLSGLSGWTFLMLLGTIAPLINTGAMRLM